jgi:hypothetical protein
MGHIKMLRVQPASIVAAPLGTPYVVLHQPNFDPAEEQIGIKV